MRDNMTDYPLKVISRTLPVTRSNKLRLSWFLLGTVFGIGSFSLISSHLHAPSWLSAKTQIQPAANAPATATEQAQANIAAQLAAATAIEGTTSGTVPAPVEPAPVQSAVAENTPIYPLSLDLKVQNGDTLINMLTDAGVSYEEAHLCIESMKKTFDPKKLDIGQEVLLHLDRNPDPDEKPIITSLTIPVSLTSTIEVTRTQADNSEKSFSVKKLDVPVERKLARAGGRIESSLYETAVDSGMPVALVSEIITAYSYDVDFQREVKTGDEMDVLYENLQTQNGASVGHGAMLFAELDLGGRTMKIYRFVDTSGHADYYNEKGESVRKALLRTPINGAKITSGFGMRNHPILGYSKMHRGVDFGAPTGTPIYAAGDGVVDFASVKGGYGNYLRIKHNAKYATAYGHISRFAKGVHPGTKVRQGQVVAYVGMTGMATGPHLHYEVLIAGAQVNPSKVKFKTGNVLGGKELAEFRRNKEKIETQLATLPRNKTDVAMNTP